MQYIALGTKTIVSADEGVRLAADAGWQGRENEPSALYVLRARYYCGVNFPAEGFRAFERIDDFDDDEQPAGLTGWKRLTTWAGAAIISWAIVIGAVALARTLLW